MLILFNNIITNIYIKKIGKTKDYPSKPKLSSVICHDYRSFCNKSKFGNHVLQIETFRTSGAPYFK